MSRQHPNDGYRYSSAPQQSLQIYLPPSYKSWSEIPMNPLEGLPGVVVEEPTAKEDFQFYCDPCHKGFFTKQRYDEHMQDHVWCSVEGCGFTCRKSKQWKLELHMETLHNRPDAPQLQDTNAYLVQRRQRFPTADCVASKVEELFYKAARGEVLPDERRRWMRQHGVVIRKRPRTEASYISCNAERTAPAQVPEGCVVLTAPQTPNEGAVNAHEQQQRSQPLPLPLQQAQQGTSDVTRPVPPMPRRPKLIPEGPSGRLSHSQRVQLIREKYRDTVLVPRFYVCNRCGVKGSHWVQNCPTIGDDAFERRRERGAEHCRPREGADPGEPATAGSPDATGLSLDPMSSPSNDQCLAAPSTRHTTAVDKQAHQADGENGPRDDECADVDAPANVEVDATTAPSEPYHATSPASDPRPRRTMQPAAAARLTRTHRERRASRFEQRRPRQPTLFDKLTGDVDIDDKGLLLQAVRFLVSRNFFE